MRVAGILAATCLLAGVVRGQFKEEPPGLVRGNWVLTPSLEATGTYDSRVLTVDDKAESDLYGELGAGARLANLGGRYMLTVDGSYAYRSYLDYNDLDDDRYGLGLKLSAGEDPLSWYINSSVKKSLNYESNVNLAEDQLPGDVLTDETKHTYSLNTGAAYEGYISDRTSLTPSYGYRYFYEDADGVEDNREWQSHNAALQLGHNYTDLTKATLTASYDYQMNEDENGHVVRVLVGASNRITDHSQWTAQLGVAFVDYEESGSDQGFMANVRGSWSVTDKVSAYLFGGNDFMPGYGGGGAREVYRIGYGANWNIRERWTSNLQVLHSYEDEVGGSTDSYDDDVKTFVSAGVTHIMAKNLAGQLGVRYVRDEFSEDKQTVYIKISKKY